MVFTAMASDLDWTRKPHRLQTNSGLQRTKLQSSRKTSHITLRTAYSISNIGPCESSTQQNAVAPCGADRMDLHAKGVSCDASEQQVSIQSTSCLSKRYSAEARACQRKAPPWTRPTGQTACRRRPLRTASRITCCAVHTVVARVPRIPASSDSVAGCWVGNLQPASTGSRYCYLSLTFFAIAKKMAVDSIPSISEGSVVSLVCMMTQCASSFRRSHPIKPARPPGQAPRLAGPPTVTKRVALTAMPAFFAEMRGSDPSPAIGLRASLRMRLRISRSNSKTPRKLTTPCAFQCWSVQVSDEPLSRMLAEQDWTDLPIQMPAWGYELGGHNAPLAGFL